MPGLLLISVVFAAYLLGSIPTGFLVARARGVDIRKVGSGNIGATNAFRVLGKPAGSFVLLVDAMKGWLACVGIPAAIVRLQLIPPDAPASTLQWMGILGGVGAVLGHNYTCWLGFKGGKGIATSAGVLAGLVPWAFLIVLGVFLTVVVATRYVSLGSVTAALALPPAAWLTHANGPMICITALLSALAIYKHRANIERLVSGNENRIGGPRKEVP